MSTSDWYRAFARDARGQSPAYERLALAVADDPELLDLLEELPEPKRQPNLLFGATRFLDGPVDHPEVFLPWAVRHFDDLAVVMRARRTQTNEPGRCAVLLPLLTQLTQPLALLEVGASAGLCLYPDAYRYRYGDHAVGPPDSPVRLDCVVEGGGALPDRVPTVVWRAGLDLDPLDVTDEVDLRWLDALIWPGQEQRRDRLRAAAQIVRADPPLLIRGDLRADLRSLAAQAPRDATLVVLHTAVLGYVSPEDRAGFAELVQGLPGHWICNEAYGVMPGMTVPEPPDEDPATFVLALDGRPVAYAAPHGQRLRWLS